MYFQHHFPFLPRDLFLYRKEGLSVVDALFQSEPLGDKPGLVSINMAFGVPLGLLN